MLFNVPRQLIKKLLDWEHWPFYLFYLPLAYYWIGYYVKSRSFWYFTSSNPALSMGGLEGEGKSEMYRLLPPHLCPKSIFIDPSLSFSDVLNRVAQHAFTYPFIVKPDVGMKGILFRKIENESQLHTYHQHMPAIYVIQEFLDLPLEISVFYYRQPPAATGHISAVIQKNFLEVVGDGTATLKALIHEHPEAKKWMKKIRQYHHSNMDKPLAKGERLCLLQIGNLYNGATFASLNHLADDILLQQFDALSHQCHFYYGRYDIKCRSLDSLKTGEDLYILEFNGAGSVPNHIHTGNYTLRQAYQEIRKHWNALYHISRYNHHHGFPHWSFWKGYRFLQASKKHFRQLKALDKKLLLHTA